MNDAALVGLALTNPQQGVAGIYDRYGTSLYNYCYSILRSEADAGDALQESFVTVMDKLAQLRDPDKLRPWLYAIARNQCFKQHRLRKRERPEDPFETGEEQTVVAASTAEPAGSAELVALVWQATAGLSEVDRSVLELNIRHELDGEELAASLGVPGPKCSVLLHRAKDRLKTAVGALIVSKVGVEACADLAGIVSGNEFSPLIRKRVARHITGCVVCEETERRHRPEAYLAAVPLVSVPAGVRDGVLKTIGSAIPKGPGGQLEPGPFSSGPEVSPAQHAVSIANPEQPIGVDETVWNPDGFPEFVGARTAVGVAGSRRALVAAAVVSCVVVLLVALLLFRPFGQQTTIAAGQVASATPAAQQPQFLPTLPPAPPTSVPPTPEAAAAAGVDPAPPVDPEPTPTPTTETSPTSAPAAPTVATVQPNSTTIPTATPTLQPSATPTVAPSPTPTPSPTSTPTPTPQPSPTPTPGDVVAPTISSFIVGCGDPFMITIEVTDVVDPSPIVDVDVTWDAETDPAIALTRLSGNTYRANVPRSELVGSRINFFVRGTLRDSAGNSRAVDLADECIIID